MGGMGTHTESAPQGNRPPARKEPDVLDRMSLINRGGGALLHRVRLIASAATEVAQDVEEGVILDATGRVLLLPERVWAETVMRPGSADVDWTGGWYSDDGHVALALGDCLDEDRWVL